MIVTGDVRSKPFSGFCRSCSNCVEVLICFFKGLFLKKFYVLHRSFTIISCLVRKYVMGRFNTWDYDFLVNAVNKKPSFKKKKKQRPIGFYIYGLS